MPLRSFALIWVALALCGCFGNRVWLSVKSPSPPKHAVLGPVAVSVSDDREEVVRGDKKSWYLGDSVDGRGRELSNHQLVPLNSQLRDDLSRELKSLGFNVVSDDKVRKLEVSIREWRYDDESRTQRYRIDVKVRDRDDGAVLAQSMLERNQAIGEIRESAAKTAIQLVYVDVVHGIVRDNPTVLAALQR
jgi:uncharacterized lipoprotein YajG